MSSNHQNKFKENVLLNTKHVLYHNNVETKLFTEELEYIKTNFCGIVLSDLESLKSNRCDANTIIYLCGDIEKVYKQAELKYYNTVNVIEELSNNYTSKTSNYNLINLGEVPINLYNTGVFFRKLFNTEIDLYNNIVNEHKFQSLTQSNKPGVAFRKGIYLTKVKKDDNEDINFNLLRCSTNLDGPTDNFRETDTEIISKINAVGQYFFKEKIELNHVLAQTYHNSYSVKDDVKKEKKAKIKEHSDKTKDMPKNATIVFCSIYKDYSKDGFNGKDLPFKKSKEDSYDYCFKNTSVLTRLRFRLKKEVTDETMKKIFDITLYPNSVFIMPLSTNRLYTHEIIPSTLPIDKIPTRMGYVVRCSNVNAVFKDDQTYIVSHGNNRKLEESTAAGVKELKDMYYRENTNIEMIDYENKFFFSLNSGDYTKPIV
jgi:hypothetical protein